ncbi:MAG: DUF2179 domain-containing protein [Hungatella sp.]|jgi:uncharacterized membrane-anchored protein YitT (DUF2179 family)|nr:DUF2179 domain-containing protein [Hungatella sp.]
MIGRWPVFFSGFLIGAGIDPNAFMIISQVNEVQGRGNG